MKIVNSSIYFDEVILNAMFYCSHGKSGCQCFFQWVQKKSTPDKASWFKSLTVKDKRELVLCHLKCQMHAENDYLKINSWQSN